MLKLFYALDPHVEKHRSVLLEEGSQAFPDFVSASLLCSAIRPPGQEPIHRTARVIARGQTSFLELYLRFSRLRYQFVQICGVLARLLQLVLFTLHVLFILQATIVHVLVVLLAEFPETLWVSLLVVMRLFCKRFEAEPKLLSHELQEVALVRAAFDVNVQVCVEFPDDPLIGASNAAKKQLFYPLEFVLLGVLLRSLCERLPSLACFTAIYVSHARQVDVRGFVRRPNPQHTSFRHLQTPLLSFCIRRHEFLQPLPCFSESFSKVVGGEKELAELEHGAKSRELHERNQLVSPVDVFLFIVLANHAMHLRQPLPPIHLIGGLNLGNQSVWTITRRSLLVFLLLVVHPTLENVRQTYKHPIPAGAVDLQHVTLDERYQHLSHVSPRPRSQDVALLRSIFLILGLNRVLQAGEEIRPAQEFP
mmetsp:Transcript_38468/g.102357  ORF Transcript_38468/g.102357 Transcript_38468/m.102357 type:complete len:421 (-) Transcript_38468:1276-2538(-)